MPGPAIFTPVASELRNRGSCTPSMSCTRSSCGMSLANRPTASDENDISRTCSGAVAGSSRSYSASSRARLRSISADWRAGCLVSTTSCTLRGAAASDSMSARSVSTSAVCSCPFHEPQSKARNCSKLSCDTTPLPLLVRSRVRSCTQTRWPSADSRTSHSTPSAPSVTACS